MWILSQPLEAEAPLTPDLPSIILIGQTLKGNAPVSDLKGILASLIQQDDIMDIREQVGGNTLLKCIIQKESTWNIKAVGQANEIGLLQFKQSTFEMFAKKYDLDLNVFNPNDQILLAEKMLDDGYGFHWTTFKQCFQK